MILGLRWGAVHWGKDKDDAGRHLRIEDTLARGRYRAVLKARYLQRGRPSDDVRVIVRRDVKRYRAQFGRACKAAQIGDHTPKDLRDSYACWLLMAGVSLGHISKELGHAKVQVTAKHYARWFGEEYREPMELRSDEAPADLLARLNSSRHNHATGTPQRDS